jgi:hypothetical protein
LNIPQNDLFETHHTLNGSLSGESGDECPEHKEGKCTLNVKLNQPDVFINLQLMFTIPLEMVPEGGLVSVEVR